MIATTRFNNHTLRENRKIQKKLTDSYKCIYGSSRKINTNVIPVYTEMIILEMNNETNTIEGIGVIRNYVYYDTKIYDDENFNDFIYKGKYHIKRDEITNKSKLEKIENKIFRGKGHLKRGCGFTRIPKNRFDEDDTKFILELVSSKKRI